MSQRIAIVFVYVSVLIEVAAKSSVPYYSTTIAGFRCCEYSLYAGCILLTLSSIPIPFLPLL
ncbi:hypothetical protein BV25DRAFT_1832782 [Artomyces pyxidatus]|uniref:Uncharacterized protein n=1 Tax=Artomyces pyxidatus TaxID=48021 RepID=A0ACB8SHD9_9AGAM|nr:hypothetical protein BV25DRAFT_1832782 [Artomyces pyxidatus]